MIKIGYLGPAGSYSEAVCKHLYPQKKDSPWKFCQFSSLSELMAAAEKEEITLAILPVQNSKNGLLKDKEGREFFSKLISSQSNLVIAAEKFWVLNFLLMGVRGSIIDEIKVVHVNPYAHEQCQEYLKNFPQWKIEKHNSSAEAAKVTKDSADFTHAAIASIEAAREYQLTILEKNLFRQGCEPIMHFLVLADKKYPALAASKDNLMSSFAIKIESQGHLKEMLCDLEVEGIEISMIRKSGSMSGYYYLDIYGEFSQEQLQKFLPSSSSIKWLGTFSQCENRHLHQDKFFIPNELQEMSLHKNLCAKL